MDNENKLITFEGLSDYHDLLIGSLGISYDQSQTTITKKLHAANDFVSEKGASLGPNINGGHTLVVGTNISIRGGNGHFLQQDGDYFFPSVGNTMALGKDTNKFNSVFSSNITTDKTRIFNITIGEDSPNKPGENGIWVDGENKPLNLWAPLNVGRGIQISVEKWWNGNHRSAQFGTFKNTDGAHTVIGSLDGGRWVSGNGSTNCGILMDLVPEIDSNIMFIVGQPKSATEWTGSDNSFYVNAQGEIWAKDAISQSSTGSDRNLKNSINTFSEDAHELLFDSLKPCTFKYNNGNSDRRHFGFIAQEVNEGIEKAGLTLQDVATSCYWEQEGYWTLRYSEFIPLNTWQIQKLKARVSELEARLSALEGGISYV